MQRALIRSVATFAAGLVLSGCGHLPFFTGKALTGKGAGALDDPLNGRTYALYALPDDGPDVLLNAIANAQTSIQLEIYMITSSGAAQVIVNSLIARAQAGVDVRVILEVQPFVPPTPPNCGSAPSLDLNKKARDMLLAGGVKVVYSNPRFVYTHEKSMVIDGRTAYVMTTNFTGAAFTNNREYIVADRDPVDVAAVSGVFVADWNARNYVPTAPNIVLSPNNSRSQLRDLIASAKRSIDVEMEFATDPELVALLGAKAKAGVDVAVMVSAQSVDRCTGEDVDASEANALTAAGVTKFAVVHDLVLHAKAIVVDGQRAYVGSENLSANSLDHNREMGVVLSDRGVVAKLASVIKGDWAAASDIPADMPIPDLAVPAAVLPAAAPVVPAPADVPTPASSIAPQLDPTEMD